MIKPVSEPWFSFIKSGQKRVEGRLAKGSFANVKVGDEITWINGDRKCRTVVTAVNKYKTFLSYLKKEKLKNTLPGIITYVDGVDIYYQWYTKRQEQRFGVVAIHIKLV